MMERVKTKIYSLSVDNTCYFKQLFYRKKLLSAPDYCKVIFAKCWVFIYLFIYLLILYELCGSLIRWNTWAQFSCCIPHFQLKEKKKQAKKEGKDKIEEEEDPEKVLCQEIMAGERLLFVLVIICTAIQTPK